MDLEHIHHRLFTAKHMCIMTIILAYGQTIREGLKLKHIIQTINSRECSYFINYVSLAFIINSIQWSMNKFIATINGSFIPNCPLCFTFINEV